MDGIVTVNDVTESVKMEFKYLHQFNFEKKREDAINEVMGEIVKHPPKESLQRTAKIAYNEGFKACLRFLQEEYWNHDIPNTVLDGMVAEVDNILI
jgi:hypothetical protein